MPPAEINVHESPFNAVGDLSADDTPALNRAIEKAEEIGGAVIKLPGKYLLASRDKKSTSNLKIRGDHIYLEGLRRGLSCLRKGDEVHGGIVRWDGTPERPLVGGGLSDLELDGNRRTNINGHAVRLQWISLWSAEKFWIHDAADYGIGGQTGAFRDIDIYDGIIERTGSDPVDFKNTANANANIHVERVIAREFGLMTDPGTVFAGIDLRGRGCRAINNTIKGFGLIGSGKVGIRCREGSSAIQHGAGAYESLLFGNQVEASTTEGTIGYHIMHARCQVIANQGHNCGFGAVAAQHETMLALNLFPNCRIGIAIEKDPELGLDADRSLVLGNIIRGLYDLGADGLRISERNCAAVANMIRAKNVALAIMPTAEGTVQGLNHLGGNITALRDMGVKTVRAVNGGL